MFATAFMTTITCVLLHAPDNLYSMDFGHLRNVKEYPLSSSASSMFSWRVNKANSAFTPKMVSATGQHENVTNRPRRIAVVGLYNSGSSVLVEVFALLGVQMGDITWTYEDRWMAKFLRDAWNEPRGIATRLGPQHRVHRFRRWIEKMENRSRGRPVALKHPLLSLSAPDVLEAWGNETLFVWAYRPLNESIHGLRKRGWFANSSAPLQTKLWRALHDFFDCEPAEGGNPGRRPQTAAAAPAAAGVPRCRAHRPLVVNYADLLVNPEGYVRRLAQGLGLSAAAAAAVPAAVAAVIKFRNSSDSQRMGKPLAAQLLR
jgi:hypothetical protein